MWYAKPEPQEEWFELANQGMESPGKQWKLSLQKPTVLYEFYKKPVAAKLTILQRSAMPERMKISTMTAEVLRRLKCTSLGVGRAKQERILKEFMNDLAAMGYPHDWRVNVLESAIKGYCRILFNTTQGTTLRNSQKKKVHETSRNGRMV